MHRRMLQPKNISGLQHLKLVWNMTCEILIKLESSWSPVISAMCQITVMWHKIGETAAELRFRNIHRASPTSSSTSLFDLTFPWFQAFWETSKRWEHCCLGPQFWCCNPWIVMKFQRKIFTSRTPISDSTSRFSWIFQSMPESRIEFQFAPSSSEWSAETLLQHCSVPRLSVCEYQRPALFHTEEDIHQRRGKCCI